MYDELGFGSGLGPTDFEGPQSLYATFDYIPNHISITYQSIAKRAIAHQCICTFWKINCTDKNFMSYFLVFK